MVDFSGFPFHYIEDPYCLVEGPCDKLLTRWRVVQIEPKTSNITNLHCKNMIFVDHLYLLKLPHIECVAV